MPKLETVAMPPAQLSCDACFISFMTYHNLKRSRARSGRERGVERYRTGCGGCQVQVVVGLFSNKKRPNDAQTQQNNDFWRRKGGELGFTCRFVRQTLVSPDECAEVHPGLAVSADGVQ